MQLHVFVRVIQQIFHQYFLGALGMVPPALNASLSLMNSSTIEGPFSLAS
jgi:hypothetical protein